MNAELSHHECPAKTGYWSRCSSTSLLFLLCSGLAGCSHDTFRANNDEDIPSRYRIKTDHVIVHSDFKLGEDHEIVDNLKQLRWQIGQTINRELGEKRVEVYLFEDEVTYQRFLTNNYPGLPPRRAYFVGTSTKLSVYTVWTDRILEDLRHEFTHGVLHGALSFVPLWLDEGLAEYFETNTAPGTPREDYLAELNELLKNGWRPSLSRLERLEAVGEMQRLDYAESWAWVHWMLHSHPQMRAVFVKHLNECDQRIPSTLVNSLRQIAGSPEQKLVEWIEAIPQTTSTAETN